MNEPERKAWWRDWMKSEVARMLVVAIAVGFIAAVAYVLLN